MRPGVPLVLVCLLAGPAGAGAQAMDRSQWVAKMLELTPAAFCQEGAYFRVCFAQSAQACAAAAASAFESCLKRYEGQMPETFRNPEEAGRWARVVGACAGPRFEADRIRTKRSTARCNDPKAWQ